MTMQLYTGSNATFSRKLTEGENELLAHTIRWGSDGYPISKVGRRWHWREAFGVKGAPVSYKTKREAFAAFEAWIAMMCDIKAGRLER